MDTLQLLGLLVLVAVIAFMIGHFAGYARAKEFDRLLVARTWREGYSQGVEDERQAAAIDWHEYREPHRKNPYGKEQ
jgi:hypothetical protein